MKNLILTLFVCVSALYSCDNDSVKADDSAIVQKGGLNVYTYEGLTLKYSKSIKLNEVKPVIVRMKKAIDYFNKYISEEKMVVTVTVLAKNDWEKHTAVKPYGMPHVADKRSLIIAHENNAFWKGTIPPENSLSKSEMDEFKRVYSDAQGNINMKVFFDLLAVHELGHIVAEEANVDIPKSWLDEFYANYFLHGYIATVEPKLMDALTLSPNINVKKLKVKYKTLQEFEEYYGDGMEALNYSWFQSRYHQIAKEVYDKTGNEGIAKMFKKFKGILPEKTNEELIDYLEKEVDANIANAFRNF